MIILAVVCILVLMAAGLSTTLTTLAIADRVEEGLDIPLEKRPSWMGDRRKFPLMAYLRIHREMYPRSRLRLYLWISMTTGAASLLVGCVAVLWQA